MSGVSWSRNDQCQSTPVDHCLVIQLSINFQHFCLVFNFKWNGFYILNSGLEDISIEEIRLLAYEANASQQLLAYVRSFIDSQALPVSQSESSSNAVMLITAVYLALRVPEHYKCCGLKQCITLMSLTVHAGLLSTEVK